MNRHVHTTLASVLILANALLPVGIPTLAEICSAAESEGACCCASDCCQPAPPPVAGSVEVRESPCCASVEVGTVHSLEPITEKASSITSARPLSLLGTLTPPADLVVHSVLLKSEAVGRSDARPPDIPLLNSSLLI